MLLASNVKEEAEGVLTLVPAEVTFERLWQPMVAHVDGVHSAVLERNPAKFTSIQLGHLLCPVERDQAGQVRRLLLRVGVHLEPPLDLVGLPLPSVLGGAGGQAGTAGVTPRVAATLVIAGAPVRAKAASDNVVVALLAEVQHSAR